MTFKVFKATPSKDWKRKNVFHTRCTSYGKVYLMIIDSGSFENLVSTEMVTKLNLKIVPHNEPYQLGWLQKDTKMRVTQCCLVEFSIGSKYHDKVWCDVTNMDACHILLGRPWQFDRKVKQDKYYNTYSFYKDGHKIVLAPWVIRFLQNRLLSLYFLNFQF